MGCVLAGQLWLGLESPVLCYLVVPTRTWEMSDACRGVMGGE